ncbi:unnamed protein product [Adineta steineri]|uniref:CBM1 domain-containing protein n=1 Tax=Adineta steineri TaxID=433720 RepID=A0A818URJ1_9BILA|nr:unnamed protein product [Adineta steineri]CAF3704441.1 unnamed protein product [Adineta steineri]
MCRRGLWNFPCNPGLMSFRRNKWFSSCQYNCPKNLGWECGTYIAPVTTILAGWDQFGGEGWLGSNICPIGYACYARRWTCAALVVSVTTPLILDTYTKCNNVGNAICPYCSPTWLCETDVVGLNEQCGGEDYVGVTRCAPGLGCYARRKWYSHCAASCPGHDWIC